MIRRIFRWFDDRLGAASFARRALTKVFPDHWSFMLGEIALYCFIILVLTGIFLTFFYVPDSKEVVYHGAYAPLRGQEMSRAYESVVKLSFEVRAGQINAHHGGRGFYFHDPAGQGSEVPTRPYRACPGAEPSSSASPMRSPSGPRM